MYHNVFIAYNATEQHKLYLYKMYSDAVSLEKVYGLSSSRFELSVVDSMLVVHHFTDGTAMIIDVHSSHEAPISQQLPTRLLESDSIDSTSFNCESPSYQWRFSLPNIALDVENLVMYRTHVDVRAVAAACSDRAQLVGFLQRRCTPQLQRFHVVPKTLLISTIQQAMVEQIPTPELRAIFDEVNSAFTMVATSGLLPTGERCEFSEHGGSFLHAISSAAKQHVLSPAEVGVDIFQWAYKGRHVDYLYLEAAALEYLQSANMFGAAQPLYVHTLLTRLKLQQGNDYQIVQMLREQPIAEIDFLFEELGQERAPMNDELFKIKQDAAARCCTQEMEASSDQSAMEAYCRTLLANGQVLRASRLAYRYNLSLIRPGTFLDAAAKAGNAAAFHSIYRMWHDVLSLSFGHLDAAKMHYNIKTGGSEDGNITCHFLPCRSNSLKLAEDT